MPLKTLVDVQVAPIKWLWSGRIPFGAITLLEGDGGVRKSTLALNIAAAVTLGCPLPGARHDNLAVSGGVMLLGDEDGYAATVRPRLDAMNANLNRIFFFEDEAITLEENLDRIEHEVKANDVRLIIIDPLSGFIGTDSNREQAVRRVLTRVARMATRADVAVLAIRHLTKARASAGQAGVGSVAISAVARAGLVMARDPAGSDEIILAQYKNNLAIVAPSLRLHFDGVRLQLAGTSQLEPSDLIKPTAYNERSALGDAVSFLQETLSQGGVTYDGIHKLATKAGVNRRTLRKAKDLLAVESRHEQSFHGPWYWHMPGDARLAPAESGAAPPAGSQGDLALQGHLVIGEASPSYPAPRAAPATTPRPAALPPPSPGAPNPEVPPQTNSEPSGTRFSLLEVD